MTGGALAADVRVEPLRWWHLAAAAALDAELFGATAWRPETFWSELARPETRCYLAGFDPDGGLVGYAGLMLNDGGADVQTLAVAPSAHRRGIGATLLVELLRQARRRAATSVMLEVRSDNAAAIALYTRFGFERIAVRRGYYQVEGADAWIMRRRLQDRAASAGTSEDD